MTPTPPFMTATDSPQRDWQKSALQDGWWILRVLYVTQGEWQGIMFTPTAGPFPDRPEAAKLFCKEFSMTGQTFVLVKIDGTRGSMIDVSTIPREGPKKDSTV